MKISAVLGAVRLEAISIYIYLRSNFCKVIGMFANGRLANTLHTHRFPSSLNKAHKMTFFILCKSKLKTLGENNLNA